MKSSEPVKAQKNRGKKNNVSPLVKLKSHTFKKNAQLTLLALPALVLLILFCYVPLPGLVLAFKNYNFADGIFGSPWVGLDNFKFIFSTKDALLAFRNTILYNAVFIVTLIGGSMLLAILLNEIISTKFLKFYQTSIFLPYFLSWSVITYIVLALLDNSKGAVNNILASFGNEKIAFYFEEKYWPFIHVFLNFWKNMGFYTLLYYANIISIDPSLYEAARIDGANKRQLARHITIPCLIPMVLVMFLQQLGRIFFTDFGQFLMVTQESPILRDISSTLDTYIYTAMRGMGDIGMGAAAGLFQSVAGFTLVLLANGFIRRRFGKERAMF